MIIKKYLAKSEKDAIEMAKEELGSSAIVMNIKKVRPKGLAKLFIRGKVEVTAALDDEPSYSEAVGQTGAPAGTAAHVLNTANAANTANIAAMTAMGTKNAAQTAQPATRQPRAQGEGVTVPPMPGKEQEESLEERLAKLQALLEQQMQERDSGRETENILKQETKKEEKTEKKEENQEKKEDKKESEDRKTMACKDLIYKQLIQNEVDAEIADSIMDEVNRSLPMNASLDQILGSVYQKIILMTGQPYLIDTKSKGNTKFVFFLGSTGVGKTTTIAKIASKLKLEKNCNVALVTADTYRIAAVEQLKTYANILSIPLKVIYTAEELGAAVEELEQYDLCLVDTAGRSHRNKEQIEDIRQLMEQIPIADRQVYLVLNAGTKYSDLKEISEVYSSLTDYSIIFTKLDETSSAGAMLNMRVKTDCPLSYVTWGQNVPDDIGEIDAQKVAKQLLGGSKSGS